MADINVYLAKILAAIYGEEVRGSIHDAIKAINDEFKPLLNSEYEALPDSEKVNGTFYFIEDTGQILRNGVNYSGGEDSAQIGIASGNTLYFKAANAPAKTFNVELLPVQDTHGWGSVYAGGRGKNKFEVTASTQEQHGIQFVKRTDGRIIMNGTSDAAFRVTLGTFERLGNFILNGYPENNGGYLSVHEEDDLVHDFRDTGSGVTFTADDGFNNLIVDIYVPYNKTFVDFVVSPMIRYEGQGSNIFAPYSNICPITKNSAVFINSHGVNLFNKNGVITKDGYIINQSGVEEQNAACGYLKDIKVQPDVTYTINGTIVDDSHVMYIYEFDDDGYVLIPTIRTISKAELPYSFKTSSFTKTLGFSYVLNTVNYDSIQLEVGASATQYMAYNDHYSYSLALGIQSWGGLWHALEGKLDEHWVEIASYAGEQLPAQWLSDRDNYSEGGTPTIGAQVVYYTPTVTRKDTNALSFVTIFGINTVWTDHNDKLYIEYVNQTWEDVTRKAELTYDQYSALEEVDQMDGTIRFITDKGYIMLNGIAYGVGGGGGSTFRPMTITEGVRSTSTITVEGEVNPE